LPRHLGYPLGGEKPDDTTNRRNGPGTKTVLTDDGAPVIDVSRDREGTLESRLIRERERRFTGFDDKILALYARRMTVVSQFGISAWVETGRLVIGHTRNATRGSCKLTSVQRRLKLFF
jgi:hypothetical protein